MKTLPLIDDVFLAYRLMLDVQFFMGDAYSKLSFGGDFARAHAHIKSVLVWLGCAQSDLSTTLVDLRYAIAKHYLTFCLNFDKKAL